MKSENIKSQHLKLLMVCNLLLGVFLFVSLIVFVRNILIAFQESRLRPIVLASSEPRENKERSIKDYEAILQKNPFGISVDVEKSGTLEKQRELSGITLVGTISSSTGHGYAVFVGKDGKQAMFKTGESVFGVGELGTVEKYRVFIKKEGRRYEIPMTDMVDLNLSRAGSGSTDVYKPIKPIQPGKFVIDQKAFQSVLTQPRQLLEDAKLVPNRDEHGGFVLREVRKNGIYDNLGMKDGDVILRINEFNISHPEDALKAFTALRGMDSLKLDMIRDGNRMTVDYHIK